VVLFSSLFVLAGGAVAQAAPCQPQTFATYRYSPTDMRLIFGIRLCHDQPSLGFGASASRSDRSGGVGIAVDGVAPCRNRVCVVRLAFAHGNELAHYEGSIVWVNGSSDSLGPLTCLTATSIAGCRSG